MNDDHFGGDAGGHSSGSAAGAAGSSRSAELLASELRELVTSFLSAATPLLEQVVPGPDAPAASCTWCPICALVALSRGEQHPLLTAVGAQGVAVLTLLRDLLADSVEAHADDGDEHGSATGAGAARDRPHRKAEDSGGRARPGPVSGTDAGQPPSSGFQRIDVAIATPSEDDDGSSSRDVGQGGGDRDPRGGRP